VFVELDGVMERSGVWINGHHLGHRPSGYVGLRYDITDFLRADGPNVLAVRADTSFAPSSRWYAGSGIVGKVRLIETGDLHVEQGGAFVSTPTIAKDRAVAKVEVDVTNSGAADARAGLEIVVTDPDGKVVAKQSVAPVAVGVARTETLSAELDLPSPRLWDLATPNLYKAAVRVIGADGQVSRHRDRAVRGPRGEVRGRHRLLAERQEHQAQGRGPARRRRSRWARPCPIAVWRQRFTALKALGVNAIRTAHNPPSPQFLDLADQMGFVVMDELFDQWNVAKTPGDYHLFFGDWHKRDARDMLRRDRNHPSVVIWSAGNEIHDTAYPVQAKAALKSLLDVMHAADPTRPVTMGLFRPNVTGDYQNGLADMLDVVGQNYRENELTAAHEAKPTRKIVGTENSHARGSWIAVRDYAPYAGMFLWTGVDYLGEADRSGWPNIANPAGLIDRTGGLKVSGMQRAGWWAETPVIHVVRNAAPGRAAALERRRGSGPGPADHDRRRHAPGQDRHRRRLDARRPVAASRDHRGLQQLPVGRGVAERQGPGRQAPARRRLAAPVVGDLRAGRGRGVLRRLGPARRAAHRRQAGSPGAVDRRQGRGLDRSTTWPSSAPRWWTPRAWSCRRRTRRSPSRSAVRAASSPPTTPPRPTTRRSPRPPARPGAARPRPSCAARAPAARDGPGQRAGPEERHAHPAGRQAMSSILRDLIS
jgi:beta-galactosidase